MCIRDRAGSIVLEIDMNERIARTVLDLAARLGKSVYVIVGNMGVILRHPEFLRGVRCFISVSYTHLSSP